MERTLTAGPFSINKQIVGDGVTLEFVLNPEAAALDGFAGLGSFDVQITLDPLALDYVKGTFEATTGLTGLINELNSTSGILNIGAFAFPELVDFSQPLFSIDAVMCLAHVAKANQSHSRNKRGDVTSCVCFKQSPLPRGLQADVQL